MFLPCIYLARDIQLTYRFCQTKGKCVWFGPNQGGSTLLTGSFKLPKTTTVAQRTSKKLEVKKKSKTTIVPVQHTVWYDSLSVPVRLQRESPSCDVWWRTYKLDMNTRRQELSSSALRCCPIEFNSTEIEIQLHLAFSMSCNIRQEV